MLTIGSYLCRNLSDSGSPDQAVVFDALEVVGIKHTEHTKKGRLYFIIVSITKGPPWVIWPSSDVDLMLYCPVSAEVMRSRYPWMLLSQLITWRAHAHTHKSLHTRTHTKTQMFVYGIKTTRNPAWNKSYKHATVLAIILLSSSLIHMYSIWSNLMPTGISIPRGQMDVANSRVVTHKVTAQSQ